MTTFELLGFGAQGWGHSLLRAAFVTLALAVLGFSLGSMMGVLIAKANLSRNLIVSKAAATYTMILRGVPDLLVIYLFYFGGSIFLGFVGRLVGVAGFLEAPPFVMGVLALGFISAAYQAEVFRGAYMTVPRGEIEAATAIGMSRMTMFRRIVAPLVLRYALPGLGNVWQLALKESALISVTGLVELIRQAQLGAGSTRRPFEFFVAVALIYMMISAFTSFGFRRAENSMLRPLRRSA